MGERRGKGGEERGKGEGGMKGEGGEGCKM